ncbi:alpha/beta hydrolase [Nocardioides pantholopis]|uniref:alpha/beta hydrolase n=1 Tax=Nocardioides pantholopis TaxID=2483798 RepID=UPI000FDB0ECE|nr:alpha/beta hydrolase [Nocardioides pantholopis]
MSTLPPEPRPVPPLTADPASVHDCAAQLRAASAQIDDLGSFAAGSARVPSWEGVAARAYQETVRSLGRRADALSLALRSVAARVDQHADDLEALDARRLELGVERDALVATIVVLRLRLVTAGLEDAEDLRAACEDCARRVRVLEAELDRWSTDLIAAEEAVLAVFARTLTVQQAQARHGGRRDPADDALGAMPGPGASATEVSAWWAGLSRAAQAAVLVAAPGAVGNRDGVPARARHAANTVSLDRDLAAWSHLDDLGLLPGDAAQWLANARAAQRAVARVEEGLDPQTGLPITAQLYAYDPAAFDGDGAVAVAAGDLDTAADVAVTVPGLGTDAGSAPSQATRAVTLYEATRSVDGAGEVAALLWIGYDAPDNLPWRLEGADAAGVAGEGMARAGGERLADLVDGLRGSRPGDDPPAHLTVIGYSYGSTTAGLAAAEHALPVDDLVFVGSPGAGGGTDGVADIGVDPDHVWAGANSRDPVADLGNRGWFHLESALGGAGLGDDPVEDDFGATRFRAESTTRADEGGLAALGDHGKYFKHDTESLYNLSQIVSGHHGDVLEAAPVTDPWWGGPQDPEWDREPTTPDTLDEP